MTDSPLGTPIDWPELITGDYHVDFVIPGLILRGAAHSIVAASSSGKSEFILWAVARAVRGIGLDNEPIPPIRVVYLDWEMNRSSLQQRIRRFGFDQTNIDRLEDLEYYQPPDIGGFDLGVADNWPGGALADWAVDTGVDLVIFDTYSRSFKNPENDNDTHMAWWELTGMQLQKDGIAFLTLDHEGHSEDAKGRARGGSSKKDMADIVLYQEADKTLDKTTLTCKKNRYDDDYPIREGNKRQFHRDDTAGIVEYRSWSGSGEDTSPGDSRVRVEDRPVAVMILDQLQIPPATTRRKIEDSLRADGRFLIPRALLDSILVERRAGS